MNKLLIIDGNGLMHRAYHALPPFSTKTGLPTNAMYGFLSMMSKAIGLFKPTHLAICFDRPEPTFRKKIYDKYQIQRPKMENNLAMQFPAIKEVLHSANIKMYEKAGIEADDIIGTITNSVPSNTYSYIVTGDKDMLQLVSEDVFVVSPHKGISDFFIYTLEEVKKRFNVNPNQIPDLKSLMGDSSDNYKGIKGIGPKIASELLSLYGSLENVYKNLDKIQNNTIKNALIQDKEHAFLSKNLATIRTHENIMFKFDETLFTGYPESLRNELLKYEFYSLSKRFFPPEKNPEVTNRKLVSNQQSLF